ncbi:MAG: epimerase, partial [Crocinitomicaceae bacterium]|nr:epimerase [Crocinitomicaceae bacterium]
MKTHLVSGGCGFVGRNMVSRLYQSTNDRIIFVDDLSVGTHPSNWLGQKKVKEINGAEVYGDHERLVFLNTDFRFLLRKMVERDDYFQTEYNLEGAAKIADVYHFAAIVGGRAKIDGDPMMVALDLSIDAEFFYWVCKHKPGRCL